MLKLYFCRFILFDFNPPSPPLVIGGRRRGGGVG
jgi:hypothetical protein